MVFSETFYVKDKKIRSATLPDIIVRCGPLETGASSLEDPTVVVEVVSPGSEGRDRVTKWGTYRKLASLQHCVLVERDRASIDVFDRTGEIWATHRTIEGLSGTLDLAAIDVSVPLREIYNRVPVD